MSNKYLKLLGKREFSTQVKKVIYSRFLQAESTTANCVSGEVEE
jgi:hypothetical protein